MPGTRKLGRPTDQRMAMLRNLVTSLLENGRIETTVQKAKETECRLVGLSALMTTTVPAMEKTIEMLHREISGCKVMVGGAVLTQEYSKMINADFYAKDGMDGVKIAQSFYGEK